MNRNLLLKVLESARGKALSVDDVMMRARLDPGVRVEVRRVLRQMAREGLCELEGKRFLVPREPPKAAEPPPKRTGAKAVSRDVVPSIEATRPVIVKDRSLDGLVVGTIRRHRDGYGFIASLHGGEDLFVPPQVVGDALDGDLVEAKPGPGRDGRPVARTMRILERRRQYAVGTYREGRGGKPARVEPRDEMLPPILVRPADEAKDGDVVRVRLERFEEGLVRGTVVSRLGLPGDPDVEVLSVAYGEGFADVFPVEVQRAAEAVPPTVRDEDKAGRRDLTGLDLVTIDGEDARDFDDAVYVETTSRGERLVVAIADVTAYVTDGNALDREAQRRATSVYFPQHVLPMLPERLSNGICSLNPHVERLCMVADMVFDPDGRLLDTELYPAVMLSKARCTYTKVQKVLEGESVPEFEHVREMLLRCGALAKKLTARRMDRGAIDFDLPESYVKLDANHQVVEIDRRPRNDAHRLVEAFMLAANEAVAAYFETRSLPTVYRVHGPPKEEKLRQFAELAGAFGHDVKLDAKGRIGADALNDFLERVAGRPEQRALHHLLLRSMMQAVYSAENIGHFGLAAESYLHFTSPIRRYPDLIVHRLLKEHWARGGRAPAQQEREKQAEDLEAVAVHCSERERAATAAEREIDAYYAAAFMVSRVGETFEGTIASVAEFGLFVELDKPYVQGLVRAETIGPHSEFDPERHRLVFGRGGGLAFSIGDKLRVTLTGADPVLRRIELALADKPVHEPRSSRFLADAVRELAATRGGKRPGAPRGPVKKERTSGSSRDGHHSQRSSTKKGPGKRR